MPPCRAPIDTMSLTHSSGEVTGSKRWTLHEIVSSVGPYRFSTVELTADAPQRDTSCRSSGSPQNRLHRRVGIDPGSRPRRRRTSDTTLGEENQTVIPWRDRNSSMDRNAVGGTQTSRPPQPHAVNMSNMARSKVRSNVWENTSSRVKP